MFSGESQHLKSLGVARLLSLLQKLSEGTARSRECGRTRNSQNCRISVRATTKEGCSSDWAHGFASIPNFLIRDSTVLGARRHYNCSDGVRDVGAVARPVSSDP